MLYVNLKDTIQHYTIFSHARWETFASLVKISSTRRDFHWLTVSCSIANDYLFVRKYQLPDYYDTY